eukprot:gene9143-9311_t
MPSSPALPVPICPLLHTNSCQLAAAVLTVARHSLAQLDLRQHAAKHPRLGVLDHISLHPLGPDASLQLAAQAALVVGKQLAEAPYQLPVYFYGAAHAEGRRLADIRRHLEASAAAGVVTVGAVPWVVNYNVPLYTDDMAAARRVARAVSARGGGLAGVEVSLVRQSEVLLATAAGVAAAAHSSQQE